ncbi:MAG: AEC family transporter [Pseudomonadales bacterium]|nr:AEC family transporter [Pseudomonadales bacterium]
MILVADIVLPVFGLVLLGFVSGRLGWIGEAAIEGLSTFVFTFAIPVMLFRSAATASLPHSMPWSYLLAYYGSTLCVFGGAILAARALGLRGAALPIFAMSASYSNVVLLGIPLIIAALGDAARVPLYIIISTHAAMMFMVTTFGAETARGDTKGLLSLPLQTARVLLRNMIVVGLLLGLAVNLAGFTLPGALDKMAAYLGGAALPCAVFSMGASISRYRISGDIARIGVALALKNCVHPLIVWVVATQVFRLPDAWTATAVLLAACPSGINAYLFANRYREIVPVAATVVVLSTLVSIPILSVALYVVIH